MKSKWLIFSLLMLLMPGMVKADTRSEELLHRLERKMHELGRYRVDFALDGQSSFEGYYRVRGERYYISLGQAEAYSDGKVRYEVDASRREVVIDYIDPTSSHILNNPTEAFAFVDGHYDHKVLLEQDGIATLQLDPLTPDVGTGRLLLYISTESAVPISITYQADSDPIPVRILKITADKEPLPLFDAANYPDFEIIDFR